MATSRMVTRLLRSDNVAYALRPVSTFTQIKDNYQSFVTSDIKTVIMINCGAVSIFVHVFNAFFFGSHLPEVAFSKSIQGDHGLDSCLSQTELVPLFSLPLLIPQMHNIPKEFELDKGGDVRFIIFDNHRPFHLANRDSRHNVVVFVDEAELLNESMDWPSSGSENEDEDDSESGGSDDENDDDDNDDEEEEVIFHYYM